MLFVVVTCVYVIIVVLLLVSHAIYYNITCDCMTLFVVFVVSVMENASKCQM